MDGEAVVVTKTGDTDFAALESYVSARDPEHSPHHLVYYAFDLLHLNGRDLSATSRRRLRRNFGERVHL